MSNLRIGSRGASVTQLQDRLSSAGFNPGASDGIYGRNTEAAVRAFQQAQRIQVDGIVGPQTRRALDSFQASGGRQPTGPRNDGDTFQQPSTRQPGTGSTAPIGDIPRTGNAFIDRVSADAIRSQRETGVPASVTMAQAILESGWGRSGLARDANNFFGIKGEGPAGHVTMRTREVRNGQSVYENANFRRYNSPAESFTDHGRFLRDNPRYANAFRHIDNPQRFAQEIARAGYATDPNYASLLNSIIQRHGLERFDAIARGQ